MYEQNASCLVKYLELGAKNLNKIRLKIVKQVLKWLLQYVNFQNFPGEHVPGPRRAFFILNVLQNNSAREKYAWKYVKMWCPHPEKKILNTLQT